MDYPYIWFWRKKLPERKDKPCRVLVRSSRMNSALIEFEDGFRVVSSRNAVRKIKTKACLHGINLPVRKGEE